MLTGEALNKTLRAPCDAANCDARVDLYELHRGFPECCSINDTSDHFGR